MTRYVIFAVLIGVLSWGCYLIGERGAAAYERMLIARVTTGLEVLGYDWAEIEADGLSLELHGHAPDLFARELALESARATAPIARIESFATAALAPPEHRDPVRVELHRDQRGVTMTGQTANREMRQRLNRSLASDGPKLTVHDLTGIQAQKPPRGWGSEILVATLAASRLPNAYVVMEPGRVTIEGQALDEQDRETMTHELLERAGESVQLVLRIRTPAVVVAPFVFSVYKEAGGGLTLESCTARTREEKQRILSSVTRLGAGNGIVDCVVGLGGPSAEWGTAVEAGLAALSRLPAGRLDVEYRSARLIAVPPTSPHLFEEVQTALLAALPDGFDGTGQIRSDDVATRTEMARGQFWLRIQRAEDAVLLAGKVPHRAARTAITTFASARFGQDKVRANLTIVDHAPPAGWQGTAIRLLDTLAGSVNGEAEMAGNRIVVRASVDGPADASRLHQSLLDTISGYEIETRTTVDLPAAFSAIELPPVRCASELNTLNHKAPVDFDPGSAVITADSTGILDTLAASLKRCTMDAIEIGGHTDAKGSEELNQRLSQARAEAVVKALQKRGVAAVRLTAKGYGETVPIADNATEEGRARNRRIEFKPRL